MTSTRKIIFLDVDGVLHPEWGGSDEQFQESCMKVLARIVCETGADIVLSTSWRIYEESMRTVNRKLVEHGMKEAIDRTCNLGSMAERPQEILAWIKEHSTSDEDFKWIALDDIDMSKHLGDHMIPTNSDIGLEEIHAVWAIAVLNGEDPEAALVLAGHLPG